VSANALLAGNHQVDTHQPISDRDTRTFKDCANCDGKLLSASLALIDALASAGLCIAFGGEGELVRFCAITNEGILRWQAIGLILIIRGLLLRSVFVVA
jgi:hypothetical protein